MNIGSFIVVQIKLYKIEMKTLLIIIITNSDLKKIMLARYLVNKSSTE